MKSAIVQLALMVSKKPDFGQNWSEREELAEKTGSLNFGCKFDKHGQCASIRAGNSFTQAACCSNCAQSRGYFHRSSRKTINPSAFQEIKEKFDERFGFWRPGIGCTLSRKFRSALCISFQCRTIAPKNPLPKWVNEIKSCWQNPQTF